MGLDYQKELICVRCDSKGTIKKVKVKGIFSPNDEHVWYICTACKGHSQMFEALANNWEDFPTIQDDEWEWADPSILEEECRDISLEDYIKEQEMGKECGSCKNLEGCETDPSPNVIACSDHRPMED